MIELTKLPEGKYRVSQTNQFYLDFENLENVFDFLKELKFDNEEKFQLGNHNYRKLTLIYNLPED